MVLFPFVRVGEPAEEFLKYGFHKASICVGVWLAVVTVPLFVNEFPCVEESVSGFDELSRKYELAEAPASARALMAASALGVT